MSKAVFEFLILGLAVGTIIGVLSAYFTDGTMPSRRWVGLIVASVLGVVGLCAYHGISFPAPSLAVSIPVLIVVAIVFILVDIFLPLFWHEEQFGFCIAFIVFEIFTVVLFFFSQSMLVIILWSVSLFMVSLFFQG